MRMTFVVAIAITALFSFAGANAAREYPWCQRYSRGGKSCMFDTRQQCLDTVRGTGGICVQNPRAKTEKPRRRNSQ